MPTHDSFLRTKNMADSMKEESVAALLKGIDRYNPDNLQTLEHYVQMQAFEQTYNLDANLAVLKLYQFNPSMFKETVTCQILLKALMNLPNTDFILCKCLIIEQHQSFESVNKVISLSNLLETCEFQQFWQELKQKECQELIEGIKGFKESIKKFIASVLSITYQSISKSLLLEILGGDITEEDLKSYCNDNDWKIEDENIFLSNQEEHIKSKNISEKITFDNVAPIIRSAAK
ncbi:eukaryotic translation initiation factor 3 subunit K-like [Hydractinia symbiolongicarpus]|uniref:eukaryotic translation initiation factor 3 subunit K-like n=1 Tax=Hydractinia symbiolongicarpus TaxID=13093 RepID=UPI002550DB89|nr:eukaryotic translation initiation factor 3 subunit K-like [Hydractinia symbiolongicarpus]